MKSETMKTVLVETGRLTTSFTTGLAIGRLLRSVADLYDSKAAKIAIFIAGTPGGLFISQFLSTKVAEWIDDEF